MLMTITFFIVIVMMMVMLVLHFLNSLLKRVIALHCGKHLLASKGIPIRRDYCRARIFLTQKRNTFGNFSIVYSARVAEDDTGRLFYLIVEKFTEIFHIHLAFIHIRNGSAAIKSNSVVRYLFSCADNVTELADARGLDNDTVGVISLYRFLERLAEIPHKTAADAARIHLGYIDA